MDLQEKIAQNKATICVIGLGYVGLPHAAAFAQAGFTVMGLDVSARRVEAVNRGHSDIPDVPSEMLARLVAEGRLQATSDYDCIDQADVVLICVPTPFDDMKTPDLAFILSAAEGIAPHLHAGQMIILQSTTYPGTTEEVVQPILERGGLRAGQDFHLVFSPERIDPGNATYSAHNIPKVVGGLTAQCTALACQLFGHLTSDIHPVSTPRAAEMTKLLENIFRSVNIALVNELKLLCDRMGLDVWEVIDAAATKPFGFMPFYPGPGLGGHCIPIDPFYLSWKAREYGAPTRFIELAGQINTMMPEYVVRRVMEALNDHAKPLKGARVLILGAAYKKNVDDMRESPSLKLMELLLEHGADVAYNDPHIPQLPPTRKYQFELSSTPLTAETLRRADCVLVATNHSAYDYEFIVRHAPLVVDTRNATRRVTEDRAKIVKA